MIDKQALSREDVFKKIYPININELVDINSPLPAAEQKGIIDYVLNVFTGNIVVGTLPTEKAAAYIPDNPITTTSAFNLIEYTPFKDVLIQSLNRQIIELLDNPDKGLTITKAILLDLAYQRWRFEAHELITKVIEKTHNQVVVILKEQQD